MIQLTEREQRMFDDHTERKDGDEGEYFVILKVGHQSFQLARTYNDADEDDLPAPQGADWMRAMLAKALANLQEMA